RNQWTTFTEIYNLKDDFEKFKVIMELLYDKTSLEGKSEFFDKNKNYFIDHYIEDPIHNHRIYLILLEIQNHVNFYNIFLKPVLKKILDKLEQNEDVSMYLESTTLLKDFDNDEYLNKQLKIAEKCLEKGQNIDENYLGINIVSIIYKKLTQKQQNKINNLIDVYFGKSSPLISGKVVH
ncbi:MAG: hypothetical protein ACQERU_12995, partial [Bacteroidota bacterium]